MKAIILAAGKGSRFGRYTSNRPKSLLKIAGKPILERQIGLLRRFGIDDIVVVRGFAGDQINIEGVRYYEDRDYHNNMVYSLFCAGREIDGDIVITYADILYDESVMRAVVNSPAYDIGVVVDTHWEDYYRERFGDPLREAESLVWDSEKRIIEIGAKNPELPQIDAQYIGIVRLSGKGSQIFRKTYFGAREKYWNRVWLRGRIFQKIHMTDFLQIVINKGYAVHAIPVKNGWLEFDYVTDYELVLEWISQGSIDRYFKLSNDHQISEST